MTPEEMENLRAAAALIRAEEWACWDGFGPCGDGKHRAARIGPSGAGGIYPPKYGADIVVDRDEIEAAVTLIRSAPSLLAALDEARRERDAYKRAKAENDERFMRERDEARSALCRLIDAHLSASDTERQRGMAEAVETRRGWGM